MVSGGLETQLGNCLGNYSMELWVLYWWGAWELCGPLQCHKNVILCGTFRWNIGLKAFSGTDFNASEGLEVTFFVNLGMEMIELSRQGCLQVVKSLMIVEKFDLWGLGTRKLQKHLKIDPFWFVLKSLKSRQSDKFWSFSLLRYSKFTFCLLLQFGI